MIKRALKLIFAVTLPLCFILCGCGGGKRLTADEYKTQLRAAWEKYVSAETTAASYLTDNTQINSGDIKLSIEAVRKYSAQANVQYDLKEQAMDEMEKLEPPKEYDELHKALKNAVKDEREYTKLQRALFNITNEAELLKVNNDMEAYNNSHPDGGVPAAVVQIVLKLNEDTAN